MPSPLPLLARAFVFVVVPVSHYIAGAYVLRQHRAGAALAIGGSGVATFTAVVVSVMAAFCAAGQCGPNGAPIALVLAMMAATCATAFVVVLVGLLARRPGIARTACSLGSAGIYAVASTIAVVALRP